MDGGESGSAATGLRRAGADNKSEMEARFNSIEAQFDALDPKAEARFASLLSPVNESRANLELTNARVLAALSERVAVLETRRQ